MDWKRLSRLSYKKIQALQNKKLKAFIRYNIWPYHPYYRRLFKEHKLDTYSIQTTDDLARIPFTTKDNVAPTKKEPKKYIDFILAPNKESIKRYSQKTKLIRIMFNKKLVYDEYKPIHIHLTAGRTSLPTPFLYTNYDLERLKEAGKRVLDVFNVPQDSVVVNGFPYAPHLAFWQTYYALIANNLLSLETGGGKIMGTNRIIKAIESMKANVLVFIPGYAYHLIREAAKQKRDFSSVKYVIFGGERVPKGLKEKIRGLLKGIGSKNNKILGTYAFTEGKVAWPECGDGHGYHTYPDFGFIESVNEKGERVNEKGEIVYTALDFRGSVVLRYKTGDISKIYYEKCPNCGRTVPRIDENIERRSDYREFKYAKVKGTLINLNLLYGILMGHKDVDEWQIEIKKKNNNPYEVDEFIVYIAPNKKAKAAELKLQLQKHIYAEIEITPEIIIKDLDELLEMLGMETELKEKRIVDRR